MARVWVKPFTRADGVKVKGYWRETSAPPAQRSTKVNVMKNDSARASSALSRQTRIPGDKLMKTRRAQKKIKDWTGRDTLGSMTAWKYYQSLKQK